MRLSLALAIYNVRAWARAGADGRGRGFARTKRSPACQGWKSPPRALRLCARALRQGEEDKSRLVTHLRAVARVLRRYGQRIIYLSRMCRSARWVPPWSLKNPADVEVYPEFWGGKMFFFAGWRAEECCRATWSI